MCLCVNIKMYNNNFGSPVLLFALLLKQGPFSRSRWFFKTELEIVYRDVIKGLNDHLPGGSYLYSTRKNIVGVGLNFDKTDKNKPT